MCMLVMELHHHRHNLQSCFMLCLACLSICDTACRGAQGCPEPNRSCLVSGPVPGGRHQAVWSSAGCLQRRCRLRCCSDLSRSCVQVIATCRLFCPLSTALSSLMTVGYCCIVGLTMSVCAEDNLRRNRRTSTAEGPRGMPAHKAGPLADKTPASDQPVSLRNKACDLEHKRTDTHGSLTPGSPYSHAAGCIPRTHLV